SVIEVNPRVSRSSALASTATGYPNAKVTAKIALGYTLDEIRNDITGKTCACFEPALDYVVVKVPKWPFDKFVNASRKLGTQMKATGEVMSIAPSFEAAVMKAVRGAEIGLDTLNNKAVEKTDITEALNNQDDLRLFSVFRALKNDVSVEEIHKITMIDEWFLYKLKNLADYEKNIENTAVSLEMYIKGKKLGYTDSAIERISKSPLAFHKNAVYKMVDTCAAEFAAETPYFYSSYDDVCESREIKRSGKERIIVLGSGPIRIGQGIEFDYSCVHCVWTLKELGYEVILINNNPETVSTDFDTGDRLYFEPLTPEDVMNVIKVEKPAGVVVAFGGQTAIKLTKFLDKNGIKILGTSAEGIDTAEDRDKFDKLLEKFGIFRPKGTSVTSLEGALNAGNELGYPVLLRPSYVIGGQNMTIAYTDDDVRRYMEIILAQGIENPILVDKYMMGTELEVDCISDGKDVLIPGIMEHIERAGVHSGDSIAVYPPYNIQDKMLHKICDVSKKLALSLGTKGLVNIQYLTYQNELYVIEVNPRASRTIPYISKVTGVPMVELASKIMVGAKLADLGYGTGLYKTPPYYAVKVPVFSFEKLNDVNSQLGPEMKSTGEVLGVGKNLKEALFKGLVSAGFKIDFSKKEKRGVLITVTKQDRFEIVSLAKKLDDLGIQIWATPETAKAIESLGIEVKTVNKLHEDNSIMELVESDVLNYIVYTGKSDKKSIEDYIKLFNRANQLGIATLTSLDTANALADIIASRYKETNTELVDINNMRSEKGILKFSKMQGTSDDYIFFNNQCQIITCPESFAIEFTDRHKGIGGDGIVLIENSEIADAKMRIFNIDGSEGKMAGNSIRCVGKYLYDNNIIKKEKMSIETASGVKKLQLFTRNEKVSSVTVSMGKAILSPNEIPALLSGNSVIGKSVKIDDGEYKITCLSMGNPHCVVFVENVDKVEIEKIGPKFENAEIFPERINTEFVRVVNSRTLKMRVWERGNGETLACGTGACAAVAAAVENGFCARGEDITVKLRGGDLIVNYTDDEVLLTGDCNLVFTGEIEY
ncbi:MAG: carbamoyl-phosphate synthase large subunit, partial [Clostridiales bacterium]|nr:carbamoyl-phosphate synthase large subunit [Clostridiales bacterium]